MIGLPCRSRRRRFLLKCEPFDVLEQAIDSFIVLHEHEIYERNLALYDE